MVNKSIDQANNILANLKPYTVGETSVTESNIIDALQKMEAVLDAHIGSGVNAHTPVAHYQSGFMTPQLLAKLYEIAGKRTYIGGGRDIMALEPGCYYGVKFKNGPLADDDDAILTVDVSKIEDMSKQIKVIKSYTGQTYLYTEHKNNAGTNYAAPSVWTSIPRFANLWEGSLSTVGTKFTLADRIDKYTRLIFTLNTNNGAVYDVTTISGGDTFRINTFQRGIIGPGMNNYEITLNISGKDGSVTKNVSDAYNVGASGPVVASNLGRVVKIVGVLE